MEQKYRIIKAFRHDFTIESILDEEISVHSYLYLEKEFDEKENLIREVAYNETGGLNEFFTHQYDQHNRKIKTLSFFSEDEVAEVVMYEYEEGSQQPAQGEKTYADGSKDFIHWNYDQKGRLTSKKVINDEGEEEEMERWTYSGDHEIKYEKQELGELIFFEEKSYHEDGKVKSITYYDNETEQTVINTPTYDLEGQETGMEQYDQHKRLIGNRIITTFSDGHPSEMVITDAKGNQRITRIAYDERGSKLKQQEYNEEEQLLNETIRTYTADGLIASTEVRTDRMGMGINQHYKIEYQYIK